MPYKTGGYFWIGLSMKFNTFVSFTQRKTNCWRMSGVLCNSSELFPSIPLLDISVFHRLKMLLFLKIKLLKVTFSFSFSRPEMISWDKLMFLSVICRWVICICACVKPDQPFWTFSFFLSLFFSLCLIELKVRQKSVCVSIWCVRKCQPDT